MKYYRGEDGLMHCAVCHKVLAEIMPPFEGWTEPIVATCECVKARDAAERRAREKNMRWVHSKQLPAYHLLNNENFPDWTFDRLDEGNPQAVKVARAYVASWEEKRKTGVGLLLWGSVGTGKTCLAACIVNYLRAREVPCLMTSTVKLIEQLMPGAYDGDLIGQLKQFDLLVLDDLGAESKSTYAQQQLFNAINDRVETGLPMIITTNISAKELNTPKDVEQSRIFDRISGACVPLQFDGSSYRMETRKANIADMKADIAAREELTG